MNYEYVHRWYATEWFGYKVGVTVRDNGRVSVLPPCPLAGDPRLELKDFDDIDEAIEYAGEFRENVTEIMAEVDDRGLRRDSVSVNKVIA